MRYVKQIHEDSREELKGSNGEFELPNWEMYTNVNAHVVSADTWMSRVVTDNASKKNVNRFR